MYGKRVLTQAKCTQAEMHMHSMHTATLHEKDYYFFAYLLTLFWPLNNELIIGGERERAPHLIVRQKFVCPSVRLSVCPAWLTEHARK